MSNLLNEIRYAQMLAGEQVVINNLKKKGLLINNNKTINIMANTQTAIKRVEFIIEDELTHCNVFYESSEPGNPFWGGGWKTKTFGKSVSAADILTDEKNKKHGFADYIMWNNGRSGVGDNED